MAIDPADPFGDYNPATDKFDPKDPFGDIGGSVTNFDPKDPFGDTPADPFAPPPPEEEKGIFEAIGDVAGDVWDWTTDKAADTGIDALKGAVNLGQSIVGAGELAEATVSAPIRLAADMASLVSGTDFSLPDYQSYLKEAMDFIGYDPQQTNEYLSEFYSDPRKASETEYEAAKGFWETGETLLTNPDLIWGKTVETLPQMLGIMGTASWRAKAAYDGAKAAGLKAGMSPEQAMKVAKEAGQVAGRKWAAASEGLMQAGASFDQYLEDGMDFGKAYVASFGSGVTTGLISKYGGQLGEKLGLGDIEAGIGGKGTNFFTRGLAGGTQEGLFEEMPQSTVETVWDNWANDRPLSEGLGKAAATGGIVGAGAGGLMGATRGQTAPPSLDDIDSASDVDGVIGATENYVGGTVNVRDTAAAQFEEDQVLQAQQLAAQAREEGLGEPLPDEQVAAPEQVQSILSQSGIEGATSIDDILSANVDMDSEIRALELEMQIEDTQEPDEIATLERDIRILLNDEPSKLTQAKRDEIRSRLEAQRDEQELTEERKRIADEFDQNLRSIGQRNQEIIDTEEFDQEALTKGNLAQQERMRLQSELGKIPVPPNFEDQRLRRTSKLSTTQGPAHRDELERMAEAPVVERNRDEVQPEMDSLMEAIAKTTNEKGQRGLSIEAAEQDGIDRAHTKDLRGRQNPFSRDGMGMDELAESLNQYGYRDKNGGLLTANTLAESIQEELAGNQQFSLSRVYDLANADLEAIGEGQSAVQVQNVLKKALEGKRLGEKEQRIVTAALDEVDRMRAEQAPEIVRQAKERRMEKAYPPLEAYEGIPEEYKDKYFDTPPADLPTIGELANDARDLGVNEALIEDILESQADDKTVSKRLYDAISDSLAATEAEEKPKGDLFGFDEGQKARIEEERRKAEEKQRDIEAAEKEEKVKAMSEGPLFEAAEGQMDVEDVAAESPFSDPERIPSDLKVTLQAEIIGTDKTQPYEIPDAKQAMIEINSKIDAYNTLLGCMR